MSKADRIHSTFTLGRAGNTRSNRVFSRLLPCIPANFIVSPISGRTLDVESEQSSLGNQQIGQAEQREELRRVLGQPFVAHLLHAEDILDDVKRMLNLGPDAGLEFLDLFVDATHQLSMRQFSQTHSHFDPAVCE